MIKTNVNDFLEKIEPEDVAKEYLSVEELYCLAETPCKIPVLKTASLFSCLTSLRLSDILSLCWEEIVDFALEENASIPSPRRPRPRTSSR